MKSPEQPPCAVERDFALAGVRCVGRRVLLLAEAASTNDEARRLAAAGEAEGVVVRARRQTRGRGRMGRPWASDRAVGVWLTAVVRPAWPADQSGLLAVMGGVAVAEAARALGARAAALKWPNDVRVRGQKLAGVLVEPRIGGGRIEFAAVGIGLNVLQQEEDFPPDLRGRATSLRLEGADADCDRAAEAVIRALDEWYAFALAQGEAGLVEAWSQRAEPGTVGPEWSGKA